MSKNPTVVFFGTPEYVFPILDKLVQNFQLLSVVTQPPKPAGRKGDILVSPVESWAKTHGVAVLYEPQAKALPKADVAVVASYGEIIPQTTIDHFNGKMINVHPSLLPLYRGASPIQAAILFGDKQTGVTFIQMDEKLDHGPILHQIIEPILPSDTTEILRTRLFRISSNEVIDLVLSVTRNKHKAQDQDHEQATFTRTVKKEDAHIDPKILSKLLKGEKVDKKLSFGFVKESELDCSPLLINKLIKAMTPWPLVWTTVTIGKTKKRLVILGSHIDENTLVLDLVQLEGKNPVMWKQFKEGYPKAKFS